MRKTKKDNTLPNLTNHGGYRPVAGRLRRASTIVENREAVAYAMLSMANTNITDIMQWDAKGNISMKSSDDIPEHALQSIKKVRQVTDKNGNNVIEIELVDKVPVLRLLAKASGLLDSEQHADKPSVIGINVTPPGKEITDAEN
jgi:hypothetical protein